MGEPGFDDVLRRLASGRLLRVVNFHNTPASGRDSLRRQLTRLATECVSIGLEELDDLFQTGVWRRSRPPALPVFYEGYANHASVAAPLLDELEMTGWFFVPTAFVDQPPDQQEAFASRHWIAVVEEEVGAPRLAMSRDEIAALSRRHVVAAHTATHAEISEVATPGDLEREVFAPYRFMLDVTGKPPAATAFLGGASLDGQVALESALRQAGYRYVFSNTKLQRLRAPGGG